MVKKIAPWLWYCSLLMLLFLLFGASCSIEQEMEYRDGVYTGRIHNQQEVPHGEGTWEGPGGEKHVGYWSEGELVEGKIFVEDVLYYQGEFVEGKKHGEGTLYWENGSVRYEGGWRNGNKHGVGTLYREDGTVRHQGEWTDGRF